MKPVRLWQHRNGVWYIMMPHNRMRSTRTRDRSKAERIFRKVEREWLEGRLVRLEKGERRTLEQFRAEYATYRAGLAPSTRKGDRLALEHFADFYGANRPLGHLKDSVLDKYRGHLRAIYPNLYTVNAYIRDLKTALKTAKRWGYTSVDLDGLKKFRHDLSKPRFMEADEVQRLIAAAQEHPVMKTALPVMVYCGISRAEIIQPIILGEDTIQYRRKKTGSMVSVPIAAQLRPYIAHLRPGIHRLVPWKNERTLSANFKNVVDRAGLNGISPHKVRHTFATALLDAGVDIATVSVLLGHKDVSITMRYYGHITDRTKRQAMEQAFGKTRKI